jgi:hypothetical protein
MRERESGIPQWMCFYSIISQGIPFEDWHSITKMIIFSDKIFVNHGGSMNPRFVSIVISNGSFDGRVNENPFCFSVLGFGFEEDSKRHFLKMAFLESP